MKKQSKKSNSNKKITKDMSFSEIIEKNPDAVQILFEKGMHCIGCGVAAIETLEQGALMHGIDPDKLVDEINRKIIKKSNKKNKNKNNKYKTNTQKNGRRKF